MPDIDLAAIRDVEAGTTYYVSPTGNDANTGEMSAPFATIAHAFAKMTTGDTLYICDGVTGVRVVPQQPARKNVLDVKAEK
jgi:hypothetical protein